MADRAMPPARPPPPENPAAAPLLPGWPGTGVPGCACALQLAAMKKSTPKDPSANGIPPKYLRHDRLLLMVILLAHDVSRAKHLCNSKNEKHLARQIKFIEHNASAHPERAA